jgi:hypothetical protein
MEKRFACSICERSFTQSLCLTLIRIPSVPLIFDRVIIAAPFEAMYCGSSTKPTPEELSLLHEYEDQVRFATPNLQKVFTKRQNLRICRSNDQGYCSTTFRKD